VALILTPQAAKQMGAMPKTDRDRLVAALQDVAADTSMRQPFVTELVGRPGVWRARKGDGRAVYRVVEGDVVVDRVAHRKEAYR
jgi:mRNA-degrading endonuclease RelE of RelBE toxin-antitoxin system